MFIDTFNLTLIGVFKYFQEYLNIIMIFDFHLISEQIHFLI